MDTNVGRFLCEEGVSPRLLSRSRMNMLSYALLMSCTQVEILVEDNSVVEVGSIGTVEVTTTYYDERVEDNGCDPAGCEPSLTRVSAAVSMSAFHSRKFRAIQGRANVVALLSVFCCVMARYGLLSCCV